MRFNSKLVRLKEAPYVSFEVDGKSFNSKLVRLKGEAVLRTRAIGAVSIPNWCD